MPKLTKRTIEAAAIKKAEYFLWDDEVPGFGLRIFPSGKKRFVVQYRAGRRPRRISLGPSTVLTCEQARTRAITIIAAVRNGDDPAAKRDADRDAITVAELAERFDREHIALRLKKSTAAYPVYWAPFVVVGEGAVKGVVQLTTSEGKTAQGRFQ